MIPSRGDVVRISSVVNGKSYSGTGFLVDGEGGGAHLVTTLHTFAERVALAEMKRGNFEDAGSKFVEALRLMLPRFHERPDACSVLVIKIARGISEVVAKSGFEVPEDVGFIVERVSAHFAAILARSDRG